MNIFYLSHTQQECAKFHNDKHCVKMILEYAQLLSTTHRVLDGHQTTIITDKLKQKTVWVLPDNTLNQKLYSVTHMNHPSAVWVRQSSWNYNWLAEMLFELCREYTHRYGKVHKVEREGLMETLLRTPTNINIKPFTQPTPAMPDEYIINNDSIQSYKNYYIGAKQHLANWKNREIPNWYRKTNV